MSERVHGSIVSLSLDGVPYDVVADANFNDKMSEYTVEAVATSGAPIIKKVKKVPTVESVVLTTIAAERVNLIALTERLDAFVISYSRANGDSATFKGFINLEQDESEEGRTSIQLIPTEKPTILAAS